MGDLLYLITIILLISLSALCSGLINGMYALNHYQLKRKAQFGDKHAKIVYPIHALHYQLLITLLIINIATNVSLAILISTKLSSLFAILFTTFFILVFGEIIPMIYTHKYVIRVTAFIAPALNKVIVIFAPIAKPIGNKLEKWVGNDAQVIYSKEELIRIFDGQKLNQDSDIARDELHMLRTVLEFGDKKIRDVMTPRRIVNVVNQDDAIGPILMTELHSSGHSRFPVVSDAKNTIFVGTLYIRELSGISESKKVKDIMSKYVRYVHEEESLDHALKAFLKLKHHLFVVVNNFEEFVGVLSIEDVLEEVIGKEIVDEFDKHDDLRAVAKSLAIKEAKQRKAHDDNIKNEAKSESKETILASNTEQTENFDKSFKSSSKK